MGIETHQDISISPDTRLSGPFIAMSLPGFNTNRSRGPSREPNERTSLVRAVADRTLSRTPESRVRDADEETEPDEIDPDDFDVLLTKSTSYSGGPLLGPESSETPLLRGPRRYSSGAKLGQGPGLGYGATATHSRRPSTSSNAVIDEELASELDGAAEALVPPLLNEVDAASSSYYLGGISTYRFWLIFSTILALNFISSFDSTIMASSHPVITSYFKASNSASWLSTAFLLTSTAFQPLLGSLSDSIGRKIPYMVTMVVFTIATLWCALAGSMTSFIAARAVCGLGAGGVMSLGAIIVSDLVPIERRGTYQSYINANYGVSATLGAALGGFMADYLGWRWEFGVQVPPLLLCIGIAAVTIPSELGLRSSKRETFGQVMKSFDFRGSFLLTSAITFLILGLNLGGNVLPWSHPVVIASLVIFCVSFPAFLWAEHVAARPIMPLYLIQRAPHANMIFSNACSAFLMNAIIFNIPLFFQAVLLTSATTSGLCLMVPTIFSSLSGTATGFLITWTKRLKWPMTLGASGYVVGTICLASMQRGWPLAAYLACLIPHSVGQGFQFPGTFMAILAASDQAEQAVVTSTLILWRSVGMVLGIAGSSLVVQNSLWGYLDGYVTDEAARAAGFAGGRAAVVEKVRESVESVAKLPAGSLVREQVVRSYEAAVRTTFGCCVGIAVVSVLILVPVRLPRLGSRKK